MASLTTQIETDRNPVGQTPAATNQETLAPLLDTDPASNSGDNRSRQVFQRAKILAIADDPVCLADMNECLHNAGCLFVFGTTELAKAGDIIRCELPDVVLLEAHLPQRKAVAILQAFRDDPIIQPIPIIVLTVSGDTLTKRLALESGATDLLSKPVDEGELTSRIRDALLEGPRRKQEPMRRHESRYPIAIAHSLAVETVITDQGNTFRCPVRLLDLSRSGARFTTEIHLDEGQPLDLIVQALSLEIDITIRGTVCWSSLGKKGEWQVGCSFVIDFPGDVLQQLVETAYLERRVDERNVISLDVNTRQELVDAAIIPARIIEYSSGGVRLFLSKRLPLGERVLVEIENGTNKPVAIPIRTLWRHHVEGGYQIGCSFLNAHGIGLLRECLPPEESLRIREAARPKNHKRRLWRWLLLWWLPPITPIALFAVYGLGRVFHG